MQRKKIHQQKPNPAQQHIQQKFKPKFVPKKAQPAHAFNSTNAILNTLDGLSEALPDLPSIDLKTLLFLARAANMSFPKCPSLQLTLMYFLFFAWSAANTVAMAGAIGASERCPTNIFDRLSECEVVSVSQVQKSFLSHTPKFTTDVCKFELECGNREAGDIKHFSIEKYPVNYFMLFSYSWKFDGAKLIESHHAGGSIVGETPMDVVYEDIVYPTGPK